MADLTLVPSAVLLADAARRAVVNDTLVVSARVRLVQPHDPTATPHLLGADRLEVRVHGLSDLDDTAWSALCSVTDDDVTPLVPVLTLVASQLHADVVIDGAVCPVAALGATKATVQYQAWWGWPAVKVRSARDAEPQSLTGGRGLFFSRGLDSTAVLLAATSAGDGPSHLVGLDWVDPPFDIAEHADVWRATSSAAAEWGLPLVRVSTNARTFIDPLVSWDFSHVPVLAATALALTGVVDRVGLASTHPAGHQVPFASHPDLDPLWSSASVSIDHRLDVPSGRTARAGVLASSPWAARWLAVCWEQSAEGNCGHCRKCLITMCSLWLVGAAEILANRFGGDPDPGTIAALASATPLAGRGVTAEVARQLRSAAEGDTLGGLSVRKSREDRRLAAALADAWDLVLHRGVTLR